MRRTLLSAAVAASALAGSALADGLARPPVLSLRGPYGHPLLVEPPRPRLAYEPLLAEPPLEPGAPDAGPATANVLGRREPDRSRNAASLGKSREARDDEDDDTIPARPGAFKQGQTAIPGFPRGKNVVAPHLSPDVELALSPRTSLGFFGQVSKVELETRTGSLLPVVKPQGLGAGLSLDYKFGQ